MSTLDYDLPPEFRARLAAIMGPAQAMTALQYLCEPRPVAWRVNRLLSTTHEVVQSFHAAGICWNPGWCDSSGWAPAEFRDRVTRHPMAEQGHIYIQGLASQFASILLAPQPGEVVLDLAAAPGGKASHLAELMSNQGELCVVEPIRSRFFRLRANLQRLGVTHARYYMTDGRTVGKKVPNKFDRIMLDAPCSSESRFRSGQPDTYRTWSLRKIRECQRKQFGLIRAAFQALKPGGTMVYCTCSFAPEENEQVVAHLLEQFPAEVDILPVELAPPIAVPGLTSFQGHDFPSAMVHCRRMVPSEQLDGFFFALLIKRI